MIIAHNRFYHNSSRTESFQSFVSFWICSKFMRDYLVQRYDLVSEYRDSQISLSSSHLPCAMPYLACVSSCPPYAGGSDCILRAFVTWQQNWYVQDTNIVISEPSTNRPIHVLHKRLLCKLPKLTVQLLQLQAKS